MLERNITRYGVEEVKIPNWAVMGEAENKVIFKVKVLPRELLE